MSASDDESEESDGEIPEDIRRLMEETGVDLEAIGSTEREELWARWAEQGLFDQAIRGFDND